MSSSFICQDVIVLSAEGIQTIAGTLSREEADLSYGCVPISPLSLGELSKQTAGG